MLYRRLTIGNAQIVEQTTLKKEEAANAVVRYFRENGFACQILKGSAVARYYPQPLMRSSGDIDVWLDGGRKKIYDFARAFDKDGKLYGVNYHHIHFHLIDDVHIEVHIWPSYLSSPLRNMGHSDTRNWGSMRSPLSRFFLNFRRDLYLAGHYPHEAV